MKASIIALFLLFTACASTPINSESGLLSVDRFKEGLTVTNQSLWGTLKRYTNKGDLSGLTYEKYLEHIRAQELGSTDFLLNEIANTDEHSFRAEKLRFVVCFKSSKKLYALCDDASTPELEAISREQPLPDLNEMLRATLGSMEKL